MHLKHEQFKNTNILSKDTYFCPFSEPFSVMRRRIYKDKNNNVECANAYTKRNIDYV